MVESKKRREVGFVDCIQRLTVLLCVLRIFGDCLEILHRIDLHLLDIGRLKFVEPRKHIILLHRGHLDICDSVSLACEVVVSTHIEIRLISPNPDHRCLTFIRAPVDINNILPEFVVVNPVARAKDRHLVILMLTKRNQVKFIRFR